MCDSSSLRWNWISVCFEIPKRMWELDKVRARPVSNVWTVSQSSRQKAHITDGGPVLVRESHQQSQSTTRGAFWELNVSQVINPELRVRCVEAHKQARKLLIHRILDPDAESEVKGRGSLLWSLQLLLHSHPDVRSIPLGDRKVSRPGREETVNVWNMLPFYRLAALPQFAIMLVIFLK